MAKAISNVVIATDTFAQWIATTNEMADTFTNYALTANSSANGAQVTGNSALIGVFAANTLAAITAIRGGTVQTAANLNITSNAIFTGAVLRSTSNVVLDVSNTFINSTQTSIVGGQLTATSNAYLNNANTLVNATSATIQGGTLNVTSNVSATLANISINATEMIIRGGSLSVNSSVAISNTFSVTGNVSVNGVSHVIAGNVAFDTNTLFVDSVNNRVGIKNIAPDAELTVTGTANISDNTEIGGNLITRGTSVVNGSLTVSNTAGLGNTTITGFANISSTLAAGNTTITGFANISSTLAAGNTAITGTANISSTLAAGNTTITGFANVSGTLNVAGAATVNGIFAVNNVASLGNTTVTGFANISSTLAAGDTTITGTANISSTLAAGNTTITGTANISSTLSAGNTTVVGFANISSTLAAGNTTVNGFVNASGAGIFGTTLSAGNTTVTGFANISSTLSVGNTTVTGFANISSTLAAGNTTVNGLVVLQGVSKEFNASSNVNSGTDTFTIDAHGFSTGDLVKYVVTAGNTAISGLSNDTNYYVITATSDTFQLASTFGGANINVTSGLNQNGHSFTPLRIILNNATGSMSSSIGLANVASVRSLGNAVVNGALTVSNTASVGNTTITGFANVSSSLNVAGAATVNGALTVNNTGSFSDILTLKSDVVFDSVSNTNIGNANAASVFTPVNIVVSTKPFTYKSAKITASISTEDNANVQTQEMVLAFSNTANDVSLTVYGTVSAPISANLGIFSTTINSTASALRFTQTSANSSVKLFIQYIK